MEFFLLHENDGDSARGNSRTLSPVPCDKAVVFTLSFKIQMKNRCCYTKDTSMESIRNKISRARSYH